MDASKRTGEIARGETILLYETSASTGIKANDMKWKGLILVGLLLSSVLVWAVYPTGDSKDKESLIMDAVLNYLDALHFNPLDINDEFSVQAFDSYIEAIDPGKRFLLQSEIDQLSIYKDKIDDQIKLKQFDLFEASLELIENSRVRAKKIYKEITANDIAKIDESFVELDRDKRPFASNEAELKDLWEQLIKHDYNNRLKSELKEKEDKEMAEEKDNLTKPDQPQVLNVEEADKEEDEEPKTEAEIRADITDKIKDSYKDWFKRLNQDKRSDRFETFVNTITHVFDPHTDYYNPKEKEDFDIRMGGKLEGIGARLQTDGDYTKVSSIIPGGPAWKGKELGVDDLITAVTQKGEEPIDITGMRLDDVVAKIRGKKGTVVILTVKKVDGTMADVEIERDEVIIDEGFARSLQLDVPDVIENVGYIKLPRFYSSFEKDDGNSCAKDVAREIEKLKDQKVNGIILDLRNNGGGSLQDVVEMSGLFIEDGPIVQVKPRNKPAYVYEDEDDQSRYNGPLIVMVNQFSASASEILAAALQDYERAIIVGSTSTFGKGTVQRFVDLDRAVRDQNDLKPLGNLKITMQKFYRVNGGSTQLKGVEPDIIFPDNFHFIETGEKDYDHAMAWSEIKPIKYDQRVYDLPSVESLKTKSEMRMEGNDDFGQVLENARRLKKNRDITKIPLDFESFSNYIDGREEEADKFDGLFERTVETLKIKNLEIDKAYIESDESRIARNDDWLENVSKDFYLEETMHILSDMVSMNNQSYTNKK